MNVTVEETGPCRKVIRIRAEVADFTSEYNALLTSYARSVQVPGFRKGKAPKDIVEKRFAKRINEDAKEQLVPRIYRKAVDQEGLKPVAVVDVEDVQFDKESGLDFNVTIDVAPDFKLPKYTKVTVKAQPVEVEDKAVDDALQSMRKRFARFEDSTRKEIQAEDLVQMDYVATLDGAPMKESVPDASKGLAESTNYWLHVGEPEFLPGINAAVIGKSIEAPIRADVTFPDDHQVAELAGRTATYTMTAKAIRELILPELNEEFVKQFEMASVDELKTRMRENMLEQAQQEEKRRQRGEVSEWLLEKTTLDLPQSIIEEETRLAARNIVENVVRGGAKREQIVEQQQNILDAATRTSTARVKLNYILNRIAEEEKLSVTDDEIKASIAAMAPQYGMAPEELGKRIIQNNGLDRLRSDILSDKTLDHLLDIARIK